MLFHYDNKRQNTTCFLLLAYALPSVNVTNQISTLMKNGLFPRMGITCSQMTLPFSICYGFRAFIAKRPEYCASMNELQQAEGELC